ncbi:MAG: hypothetical protein IJK62_00060 [Bacteroidales bacterium]|nr:hypothetical protein [Bacteroidales bacterium]
MKKKLASGIVELLIGAGGFAAVLLCEPKFWGVALLCLGLWVIIALFIKTKDEMSEKAKKFARSTNIICACIWLLVAAYLNSAQRKNSPTIRFGFIFQPIFS